EIDWVLQRNLRFLEDYLALDPASINQQSANVILELVKEQPGVHLAALVRQLDHQSVDDIYALIASNRIYIDLRAAPLAEPDRVRVFRDAETARAFELVRIDERANGRLNADSNGRLVRASPGDLREANRRHAI